MLGIELTEKQQKIWSEMSDQLVATTEIKHLSLQYYLLYREKLNKSKTMNDEVEKITNLFQIAFFISEKNQVTYNMRGERVSGVTFSINEIIKKNSNFQDFIFHMKQMLKVITIQDKIVQQEIESCLKKFKFAMTFHHKFVSTFKKICPAPLQQQLVQSLLWLIFISVKQNMTLHSQSDIIDITCLIASLFIYFVGELQKISATEYELDDQNYGGKLRKQTTSHVFLEYFRLKDMSKFQEVYHFFKSQIIELQDSLGIQQIFGDKNIESLYRKIDSMYMKKISDANIDERHFLRERINTVMNANRFTPFGGRKVGTKNRTTVIDNQILSHRALNYQKQQEQKQKTNQLTKQQRIQRTQGMGSMLLKRLVQNKTPAQKTPLIKATPTTNAMEMYNWVLEKTNYHKFDFHQLTRFLRGEQKQLKMINGLWKDICLNQSEKGLQLQESDKIAFLVLAAEIVYFVHNSNQNFQKVCEELQLKWFQIWCKIDSVLTYDSRMPMGIKLHLLGLQTILISKQLWSEEQVYLKIFKDQKLRSQNFDYERLFRRILHEFVYQTYFISKSLQIPENIMNSIFVVCQYSICEYSEIIVHRSLYHIILFSAYSVCKAYLHQISFHSLLIAFQQLNNLSKQDYLDLTEYIFASRKQTIDIINFYNEEYAPKARLMFGQSRQQTKTTMQKVLSNKSLINSPVKDLLGKNVVVLGDRTNRPQLKTPMTLALQAYHQSPLLKERRIKNLTNYVDGKRIIDKKNEMTREQTIKQTSMLINQRWNNTKSPESKITSTIKKTQN